MESSSFNICPTCVYLSTCVLTNQKHKVWSCSEYHEVESIQKNLIPNIVNDSLAAIVL
ncbi:hypothetical protein [Cellulophaga sp. Hel_I_12]|uniref:hypothetical protein n=1 Tax=Cellulophaga sp. Hel_I_12 TaxID=1249972 RepID=UPI0012E0AE04|nr:hypothetical protein [Cellulophaga sp. Hel_I_12]